MSNLQELFDLGIEFGYKSKINKLNGQESWEGVKNKLNTDILSPNAQREMPFCQFC
jgi:hypothetical protein